MSSKVLWESINKINKAKNVTYIFSKGIVFLTGKIYKLEKHFIVFFTVLALVDVIVMTIPNLGDQSLQYRNILSRKIHVGLEM